MESTGIQRNAFRIKDLKDFFYLEVLLLAGPNLWGAYTGP